jgi:hypothetical protein
MGISTTTTGQNVTHGSSFRSCASSYSNAALEAITDLEKRTLTMSASSVNSWREKNKWIKKFSSPARVYDVIAHTHITLKANRSTCGRSEHKFVPSKDGSMSTRLSTRYTVVPRAAASLSIGVSGWTKCETSAMSTDGVGWCVRKVDEELWEVIENEKHSRTPASMLPFCRRRACKASSIS